MSQKSKPFWKALLPTTLFGRALMILVLPTILMQLFAIYMFYERHWDSIVRNMSSALAGEVMLLVREFELAPEEQRVKRISALGESMGIGVFFDQSKETVFVEGEGKKEYPELYELLSQQMPFGFMIQRDGPERDMLIAIQLNDGTLELRTTKKRLVSSTTYIFILWMAGSALVLLIIAILFLRNQIRPIRRLALAAERFGMGQDTPDYSPRGAAEVRQAGRAFMVMRDRIQRQVTTRTEMLAGISHDLRTPLTRIRLQLAMLGLEEARRWELESDVDEMEHMIQEYLDFARGEGGEQSEAVAMNDYIRDIVDNYHRHGQPVEWHQAEDKTLEIRPMAMRRALQNIIDNAIRYGGKATVTTAMSGSHYRIRIDDEGPGIPQEQQEMVFRPFTRLDPSRNVRTGGAGLGLSIARDIIYAHGGTIELANQESSGLRVTLSIPL